MHVSKPEKHFFKRRQETTFFSQLGQARLECWYLWSSWDACVSCRLHSFSSNHPFQKQRPQILSLTPVYQTFINNTLQWNIMFYSLSTTSLVFRRLGKAQITYCALGNDTIAQTPNTAGMNKPPPIPHLRECCWVLKQINIFGDIFRWFVHQNFIVALASSERKSQCSKKAPGSTN